MGKKFKDLVAATLPPEAIERAKQRTQEMLNEMARDDMHAALVETRAALSQELGLKESSVLEMERNVDFYLSKLREHLSAMGGTLGIVARFNGKEVIVEQLAELRQRPVADSDGFPLEPK